MSHIAHVIVVSDRSFRGEREDKTAPLLIEELRMQGYAAGPDRVTLLPDELSAISERIIALAEDPAVRLIVTTGGTGVSARDVTPEATRSVIEKELPGFGELMRAESRPKTVLASVSRAIAGTRGDTLILNLPGSPGGAVDCLRTVDKPARHVIDVIGGAVPDCGHLQPDEA